MECILILPGESIGWCGIHGKLSSQTEPDRAPKCANTETRGEKGGLRDEVQDSPWSRVMWEPARSAFLNEELSSLPHPHLRILSSFQRMAVEPHWPLWRDWGLLLNFFFFFSPLQPPCFTFTRRLYLPTPGKRRDNDLNMCKSHTLTTQELALSSTLSFL